MDDQERIEMVKQAFCITYEGCKRAREECLPMGAIDPGKFPEVGYVATEVYKQLSSTYIFRVPPGMNSNEMRDILMDVITEAGIKGIIIPKEIDVIPKLEEDEDA